MSKTAPGNLTFDATGVLTGEFNVDNYDYVLSCPDVAFQPPSTSPFAADVATVTYNDRNTDLIGNQPYTGTVGPAAIVVNFENGVTITAQLNDHISGSHGLAGGGAWSTK
ncbi:hypothetical protein BKA62DRAFT_830594 [Auriculariales sp. MPI-PUGE-AT-0066]|nr:hypothetical protein BKA62DRAFT_830594 [Auriculariales sp. MPI-PUGE-AT-0066]